MISVATDQVAAKRSLDRRLDYLAIVCNLQVDTSQILLHTDKDFLVEVDAATYTRVTSLLYRTEGVPRVIHSAYKVQYVWHPQRMIKWGTVTLINDERGSHQFSINLSLRT